MLSRIRHSLDDIRRAILEINDDKLTVDDLKIIAKNLPTSEEVFFKCWFTCNTISIFQIARIKDFEDIGKLAKADQYFNAVCLSYIFSFISTEYSQISPIPRLSQRIDCMLYRRKLDLDMEEVRPELNILHEVCGEIRRSKKFKQVLYVVIRTIYQLHNVLNDLGGVNFR